MLFSYDICAICKCVTQYNFVAFAYELYFSAPRKVELEGKQPWVGVRIVCKRCANFISENTPEGM